MRTFTHTGYVITQVLMRDLLHCTKIDLENFYRWRSLRLLPAAVFFSILTWIFAMFVVTPLNLLRFFEDMRAGSSFWINMHFAKTSHNYFFKDLDPSPLLHYW